MKKDIISVFDGETERKATTEEKLGISIILIFLIPISIVVFLCCLFVVFLYLNIMQK